MSITLRKPPLYEQVQTVLRGQIESGLLPVGEKLPTEQELQKAFKVSRATVRTALQRLASEGLIKAAPRTGTVVIRAKPRVQPSELRGLTEDLREKGVTSRATVLSVELVKPSPAVRSHLELAPGEHVLKLVRFRRLAGTPFALLTSYVPESAGISPDEDFSKPLYQVIERNHHLHIVYGRDVVAARGAREDEAQQLAVEPGAPVLFIRRTAFLEHDRPIEYVEATIRSDLYEYSITLPRGKDYMK